MQDESCLNSDETCHNLAELVVPVLWELLTVWKTIH